MAQVAERIRPTPHGSFVTGAWDEEGRLVGNIGFRREPQIKSRHKGMLWGVYLTAVHRGKGTAKRLLAASLDRIKTYPDLLQVTLAVSAEQKAAWNLYRSAGFKEYGLELAALKIGDDYVDEHWMVLRLRD
jgi:RimJ/RimL family protein N-acetyltransferase